MKLWLFLDYLAIDKFGSPKVGMVQGATSTPDNATPRKSKAAEPKKTLERFFQALHMRPTKAVSADHGGREYADRGGFSRMICHRLVLDQHAFMLPVSSFEIIMQFTNSVG